MNIIRVYRHTYKRDVSYNYTDAFPREYFMVVIKLPNPVIGVYCKILPYHRTQMFVVCKELNVLVEGGVK